MTILIIGLRVSHNISISFTFSLHFHTHTKQWKQFLKHSVSKEQELCVPAAAQAESRLDQNIHDQGGLTQCSGQQMLDQEIPAIPPVLLMICCLSSLKSLYIFVLIPLSPSVYLQISFRTSELYCNASGKRSKRLQMYYSIFPTLYWSRQLTVLQTQMLLLFNFFFFFLLIWFMCSQS